MTGKLPYSGLNSKKKPVTSTPQTQPIPGKEKRMIKNDAGGYSFKIDPLKQVERFLILGTEGGTYYCGEKQHTMRNFKALEYCVQKKPTELIDLITDVSVRGRANKQGPALFALALCASAESVSTRTYALSKLNQVCRIGTHLFEFVSYLDEQRSWGRAVRTAIKNWYDQFDVEHLAFQLAKYQRRNDWSHADVIRQAHYSPKDPARTNLVRWAGAGYTAGKFIVGADNLFGLAKCFELMKAATTKEEIISLIETYRAPREVIPTQWLKDPDVWIAMMPSLGYEALLRNLGNMSSYGVFERKEWLQFVLDKFTNADAVRKARLHPIKSLVAKLTYASGKGVRGDNSWPVKPQILTALEHAFNNGFTAVEPTNKKIYLALDMSGSMGGGTVGGVDGLTPSMCTGALSLVYVTTEKNVYIAGFCNYMKPISIRAGMTLDQASRLTRDSSWGGTDAAQPFQDAIARNMDVDAFVMMTDSESWGGKEHVMEALERYRRKVNHRVKLVVVGLTATESTLGDPEDTDVLDVVGFDADMFEMISNFIRD